MRTIINNVDMIFPWADYTPRQTRQQCAKHPWQLRPTYPYSAIGLYLAQAGAGHDTKPVAAKDGSGNTRGKPDLITAKLAALHFYQLAIPAPKPKVGSFDAAAATRGKTIFNAKANCASCHTQPLFTEPGNNLHAPSEIGVDSWQADRSPTHMYRTAPLAGLWSHQKGGFYHDGRFATLQDVIEHYDTFFKLRLADQEKRDLVEYLKSL
jgi:CxxC motif-containing protein (DUF1111 family)